MALPNLKVLTCKKLQVSLCLKTQGYSNYNSICIYYLFMFLLCLYELRSACRHHAALFVHFCLGSYAYIKYYKNLFHKIK